MLEVNAVPLFIDGEDVRGDAPLIVRENPSRIAETVGSVCAASVAQADRAIASSVAAARSWSRLSVGERAEHVRAAWEFTADERKELASLLTKELGKVLADTLGEINFGLSNVAFAVEHCAAIAPREESDEEGRFQFGYVPYGVVAAIIPWNAPLILSSVKVAPALLAGNTVVVKPSPFAPLAVSAYLRRVASRLPRGVLNVVNGDAEAGAAIVGDRRIGKIAFTGSGGVAKSILKSGADHLTPSLLELGGNDAALVFEDVELTDELMGRLVFGSMLTAGQVCMAIKRLFVQRSIFDDFVARYREVADQVLVIGDPLDPRVTMGPLVSRRQRDFVDSLVRGAGAVGGKVTELGHKVEESFDLDGGYFLTPTAVTGVARDAEIVVTEQFGPTVPVLPFDDVDDAINAANDSDYGLCASIWTRDEDRAFDLGTRLHVGTVFVNTHNRSGMSRRSAFGGVKHSGYGREFGVAGLHEYSQSRVISHLASTSAAQGPDAGRRYPV